MPGGLFLWWQPDVRLIVKPGLLFYSAPNKTGELEPSGGNINVKPDFVPQMPHLVAIVGGSGAGKTWLATRLQMVFGKECATFSLDNFYRDRSNLPPRRRAQLNFDHPRAIDWPLVESALTRFRNAEPVLVPRYDFTEHRRLADGDWCQPKPLVLVEGLWLLHRPTLRKLFSVRIFLDCPEELRLERRLQRDVSERARTSESVRQQFARTVALMHGRFVMPQARWADISLSGAISADQITDLAKYLKRLLMEQHDYE